MRRTAAGIALAAAGIALAAALVAALAACVASPAPVADHAWLPDAVARRVQRNPPLGAPPPDPTNRWADSVAAAELGHLLFFDERLSASGTVSCASCHMPERGFSDPRPVAVGEGTGTRHSMTVLNAAHQRWLTWDGRADTLWSQAVQPFEAAHEMNMPRDRVLAVVAGDGTLRAADVASGLVGAVIKDPVQDRVAWKEYLETVVKERDGWKDLYRACKNAE